jgi:hypothetical protein
MWNSHFAWNGACALTAASKLFMLVMLTIAALPALATDDIAQIQNCMKDRLPARTAELALIIETYEQSGDGRKLAATMYWRRQEDALSQVLFRIDDPPALRHSAILALERHDADPELYVYVPELRSVRRMTGRAMSGSLFGTDLTYEDMLHVYGMTGDAAVELLPPGTVDGRPVHVLETIPNPSAGSSYNRIISWVDVQTCALLRSRFFNAGGRPVKEFSLQVSADDGGDTALPLRNAIVRNFANGTETRIRTEHEVWDGDLPDRLFSPSMLARGR